MRRCWGLVLMLGCGLIGCSSDAKTDADKTEVKTEAPKTDLGEPAGDDGAAMLEDLDDLPGEKSTPDTDSATTPKTQSDPADSDGESASEAETTPEDGSADSSEGADNSAAAEGGDAEESDVKVLIEIDREEEDE